MTRYYTVALEWMIMLHGLIHRQRLNSIWNHQHSISVETNGAKGKYNLIRSIKWQILNFPTPYISYRSSGERLLKYQGNLTWVIMFSILMISPTDKPFNIAMRSLNQIVVRPYRVKSCCAVSVVAMRNLIQITGWNRNSGTKGLSLAIWIVF